MQLKHRRRVAVHAFCELSVLCVSLNAMGQERRPRTLPDDLWVTQYIYSDWQVEDGLPQNSVYAIEQTRDGYLWLGTQEGLVRFDGVRFQIYDTYRVDALPSHSISALLEDRRGGLWMAMDQGGIAWLENGDFTVYTDQDGLPTGDAHTLFQSRDDAVWIGTENGLTRFDGTTFTTLTENDGLPDKQVLSIAEDRDGALWIGTDAGLSRYADGTFETFGVDDGLPGSTVRALYVSEAGAIWIGTNEGLTRLRAGEFQRFDALENTCDGMITDLLEDSAGSLWIATREDGVCRMTDTSVQQFDRRAGLSYDNVSVLFEDVEANMWVGTEGGGLNQIRAGKFAVFGMPEGLDDDVVYSVYEDREHALWMGTSTGGLHRLKDGRIEQFGETDGLSSDFVLTILEDRKGTLWVGTYDGGLCRREGGEFTCITTDDGLVSDFVRSIHQDSRDVLWIGTDAGLHRYEDGRLDLYGRFEGLPHESVMSIMEDQSGDLWVGTGRGLARIRDDVIVDDDAAYREIDEMILSIHEDIEGNLWLGTFGSGLYRLRGDELTQYTSEDGLFDDTAIQLLEDDAGALWIGSNKGIARIERAQFNAFDRGRLARLNPVVYDENDGLRSREANGGTQPAAVKGHDGRLWFSTMRGAAVIDPSRIRTNPVPPPVVLEGFLVDDVRLDPDSSRSLEPGSKKFEFRYTALSFVASEGVRFQYRLDGVDDAWVDAGSRRAAFYTNLEPGRYQFSVRAANDDGVWSETGASVAFHLQPAFYQTSWFRLLTVLVITLLAGASYRLRVRHLKARQRRLSEIVESQTAELKDRKGELERMNRNLEQEVQRQLEVIMKERTRYERELISAKQKAEESAELKATILTNMTHEIRTPLAAILGYGQILAEEVPGEQQEFVTYITDNGHRLLHTLDSILELSALENGDLSLTTHAVSVPPVVRAVAESSRADAERRGLELRVDVATDDAHIDGEESALERVLEKVIGNAIKFTEKGTVTVAVDRTDVEVVIKVADTGIGIRESFMPELFEAFKQESEGLSRSYEGSGLGLAVAKHLTEALGGSIAVVSRVGEGSIFTMRFPLCKEAIAAQP